MIDSDAINASIDRAQHTVLVVDDNPATRYSTARMLRAAGFLTAEAGSGGDALQRVAEGVSAVVLDVHLPDMSGFEVCRELRSRPATASLPVVHLSAEFTRNEDRVAGLDAGADAYLIHPVEPAVLVATLQALVRARTAEDSLRRSELRFRAIYDQAPIGIVLIDGGGHIVDVNPAMVDMLGRSRDDLMGRALADLAPEDYREIAREQTTGGGDQPRQSQFPLLTAGGVPIHLEWSMSAHVEPGLRIGIASDASERVQLEQKRRDVLEREHVARVTAERHSRTKDDFIAVLSHELRTPLNSIVGWVAILMRRNPTPELIKGLQAIERNVKTQARIISDILDVSRINSGKMQLERDYANPAELTANAVASLEPSLADKKLNVQLDVDQARQPAWIDAARYQQIVWNLMTNAIKFSSEGGVIRVVLRREGNRLLLCVQDFGQGIKPDFISRLFDRFSQSDAPGNRAHGGLGLGLSIVRHIAELHGGWARAESAGPGQGATMRVELQAEPLPGELGAAAQFNSSATEVDLPDSRPLQGLDILVVEDDTQASEMLAMVLSDRGARVRVAVDYDSAIAAARKAWPQVLVSDIGLPHRDGHELIRELRRMQPPPPALRLPAIALTAFARPEDKAKALEAGFDDHLSKPLQPHVLVTAIQAALITQRVAATARH